VRGNFPLVQKRVVRCTHVAQVDFLFLVVGTCLENQFSGLTSHEAPLHFWPSRYLRNAFPEVTEPNADYVNNFQLVAIHGPQVSRSIFDNLCRRHGFGQYREKRSCDPTCNYCDVLVILLGNWRGSRSGPDL
jgi:hypothetical protein